MTFVQHVGCSFSALGENLTGRIASLFGAARPGRRCTSTGFNGDQIWVPVELQKQSGSRGAPASERDSSWPFFRILVGVANFSLFCIKGTAWSGLEVFIVPPGKRQERLALLQGKHLHTCRSYVQFPGPASFRRGPCDFWRREQNEPKESFLEGRGAGE